MSALNDFSSVMNIYQSSGSNVGDGLTAGNFQLPGAQNSSRGVPIGNTQPYVISPADGSASAIFLGLRTASGYLPLTQNFTPTPDPDGISLITLSGQQMALQLDCERQLIFSGDDNYAVTVNGYDMYGQQMVVSGTATLQSGQYVLRLPRAVFQIASIYVDLLDSTTLNISVGTNATLGLPYTDYGLGSNLLKFLNYGGSPLLVVNTSGGGNQATTWALTWYAASWTQAVTATFGRSRPMIDLTALDFETAPILCAEQIVFGYNNLPNWVDTSALPDIADNYSTASIIGIPQYSTGWVGWQG